MLPLVGNQRTDAAACAESTVPNEFADGGPPGRERAPEGRERESKAQLQARSTDQKLLETLGRSPDRGRTLSQTIGQRSLSPGSELERRPDREDNTENELAQFLEEGLRDGLFSSQEQQPGDLLDDIIQNIPVKKLRKPYTCEDRASDLGIDADEEELPDWLKEGLQPEIPKHLKHAFREARKRRRSPCRDSSRAPK